ncbi:hypothetical protein VY88_06335 [Azospirillum thiophilum]|uniref:Uncharacterized protein n=1 Tax=Azospirillum thiophilum TaxID=528244 RepID=A0AAC8VW25_9PROT|nr:hypothetical protein AL072_06375 [Azospirillum thiophilum]KJR65735.1 hypothetical protein VY88_06335 [Azospirillum thiophilum]
MDGTIGATVGGSRHKLAHLVAEVVAGEAARIVEANGLVLLDVGQVAGDPLPTAPAAGSRHHGAGFFAAFLAVRFRDSATSTKVGWIARRSANAASASA